jgi:hypothetical protein
MGYTTVSDYIGKTQQGEVSATDLCVQEEFLAPTCRESVGQDLQQVSIARLTDDYDPDHAYDNCRI